MAGLGPERYPSLGIVRGIFLKPLLLRRPSGLVVRFLLPLDVRAHLGQRFVVRRVSPDLPWARLEAAALGVALDQAVKRWRRGDSVDLKKALEAAQRSSKDFTIQKVTLPSGAVLEGVEVADDADAQRFRSATGLDAIGVMPPPRASTSRRLSEQIERHLADMKRAGRHAKNLLDTKHSMRIFIEVVGDKRLDEVRPDDVRTFLDALEVWPANAHKLKQFKDKTATEILKAVKGYDGERLQERTKQKHRDRLATFFNACEREGLLATVPPHRALPRRAKSTGSKVTRQPFKAEEVARIFGPTWPKWSAKWPHRKWVPLLALFTGARLNELSQLYKDDFVKEGGVMGFWIRDRRPDQRLKNETSRRFVPLPSRLLELGLLDYVNELPKDSRLFPRLKFSQTSGYGDAVGDQFGRYLDSIHMKEKWLTFHSFRHTLISRMSSELGIAKPIITTITGHKFEDNSAFEGYVHESQVAQMLPALERHAKLYSDLTFGLEESS